MSEEEKPMTVADEVQADFRRRLSEQEKRKEEAEFKRLNRLRMNREKLKEKARRRLDAYHEQRVQSVIKRLRTVNITFTLRKATADRLRKLGFRIGTGTNLAGQRGFAIAHPDFDWKKKEEGIKDAE